MQFDQTKTYTNLARSFAGESQAGMRYQLIARQATAQGYIALANTVKVLAKNETVHARRFFEELNKRGENLPPTTNTKNMRKYIPHLPKTRKKKVLKILLTFTN